MSTPKEADDWESVETREDFMTLLGLLAADWEAAEAKRAERERQGLWASEWEGWAYGTPGGWLEAMQAWLDSWSTAPQSSELKQRFEEILQGPTWKTFAFILSASRSYE